MQSLSTASWTKSLRKNVIQTEMGKKERATTIWWRLFQAQKYVNEAGDGWAMWAEKVT